MSCTALHSAATDGMSSIDGHDDGSHSADRRNAFWQCEKTCSISITIASTGRLPFTARSSKYGASRTSRARPLIRSVSFRPGISESSPTCGLDRMFRYPSARLLPGRSAITIVLRVEHVDELPRRVALGRRVAVAVGVRRREHAERRRLRATRSAAGAATGRSLVTARPEGYPPSAVAQLGLGGDLGDRSGARTC